MTYVEKDGNKVVIPVETGIQFLKFICRFEWLIGQTPVFAGGAMTNME
jgi:hypothetical protein